jgi:formate hydrogenlyase subunit 3/multisubunit Na+/H+ antiporter MnhD subunit
VPVSGVDFHDNDVCLAQSDDPLSFEKAPRGRGCKDRGRMSLYWIPTLLVLGAIGPMVAARWGRSACAAITALFPAVALAAVAFRTSRIFDGHVFRHHADWIPTLGLNIAFRLDGLSLLFSTLILGIGLLVILYARYYLSADGFGRSILCLSIAVHGIHGRRRACKQSAIALVFLGTHQHQFIFTDWILAPSQ